MADITLLDGGMGQELVHRAGDKPTPLWSTQVMLDHPGLVAQVHQDFADAGATVATTNTYAIHRDRLVDTPVADRFEDLYARALAEVAGIQGRIAGSIGPLVASYRPDLHPAHDVAVPAYEEVARIVEPSCDLLIGETVASIAHAEALLAATTWSDKPVWIAFTVDDEDGTRLRSGELLADAMRSVEAGAAAILVNCSAPEAIPAALAVLAKGRLPFGAYANGFTQITKDFLKAKPTVDALTMREDFTPEVYARHALKWADMGATLIGGCCEVGPAHIAETARTLVAMGHRIV